MNWGHSEMLPFFLAASLLRLHSTGLPQGDAMTAIFTAVESFQDLEARIKAREEEAALRQDPLAGHYAKTGMYRKIYDLALQRLGQLDMLSLAQASARAGLSPEALRRKAERGQVVMIDMEGVKALPDWQFDGRGRIKPFHLAIAREFSQCESHDYFKFMTYLDFMGHQTLEFTADLPRSSLQDVFRAVGVTQGSCRVLVRTPMFEAADRARRNPALMAAFIDRMGAAITRIGGMGNPNEGGFSDDFLHKYVPASIPHRDRWRREGP